MTLEQYNHLINPINKSNKLININDLTNKSDRILIYGYTCERDSFMIEIIDWKIQKYITKFGYDTNYKEIKISMPIITNEDYIPNKRIYPQHSDHEFCSLLLNKGLYLPFTTYTKNE